MPLEFPSLSRIASMNIIELRHGKSHLPAATQSNGIGNDIRYAEKKNRKLISCCFFLFLKKQKIKASKLCRCILVPATVHVL